MANIYYDIKNSRTELPLDLPAGTPTTFSIDNSLNYSSYFVLETVRNADGFYDATSPKNLSGSFSFGSDVLNFVKSDYIAAIIVPPGGSELRFEPATDITGSTLYLRGTGAPASPSNSLSLLLDLYPATAAYSLRKLKYEYTGSAVRVRRDSDNAEQDIAFSGNDLDTAALESFVNSETTTLPADFDSGAAAAYSLRYVSDSYSGPVIKVRRSSDNAEQDFTPSEITDGNMAAWVNTDVVKYTSDFTSGNEDLSESNGIGTDGETIAGVSDAYKFTLSGGSASHDANKTGLVTVGRSYRITFEYYIPSGQTVDSIQLRFPIIDDPLFSTTDQWVSVNIEGIADNTALGFRAFSGGSSTIDADGDVFYLKNIVITQTTADGHVTTWYDQSGNSNDATQATAASQPKIYDSSTGVVLENGKPAVQFNGTSNNLQISNFQTAAYTSFSVFSAINATDTVNGAIFSKYITGTDNRTFISRVLSGVWSSIVAQDGAGLFVLRIDSTNNPPFGQNILSNIYSLSQSTQIDRINIYRNGNITSKTIILSSDVTSAFNASANFEIGSYNAGVQGFFQGTMQDVIFYDSDQSANRTEIEYAINDYYNIYTPTANGFVTTWHDQAGSNDATQATAGEQPKIYDSSTGVILENGKPAITFSTDLLNAAYSGISGEDIPFTMIGVVQTNVDSGNRTALSLDKTDNVTPFSYLGKRLGNFGMDFRDDLNVNKNARFVGNQNDQILLTGICEGITTSIYLNGTQKVNSGDTDLGAITRNNLTIGAMRGQISTTNYWDGNLQELLLYATDQSANRAAIESNINDYFNIYP